MDNERESETLVSGVISGLRRNRFDVGQGKKVVGYTTSVPPQYLEYHVYPFDSGFYLLWVKLVTDWVSLRGSKVEGGVRGVHQT